MAKLNDVHAVRLARYERAIRAVEALHCETQRIYEEINARNLRRTEAAAVKRPGRHIARRRAT